MNALLRCPPKGEEVESSDAVAIYRRREKLVKVAAYVAETTKSDIATLCRAWTAMDRVGYPGAREWTESEAVRRLLEAAIAGAKTELGLPESATEADVDRAMEQVVKRLKNAK